MHVCLLTQSWLTLLDPMEHRELLFLLLRALLRMHMGSVDFLLEEGVGLELTVVQQEC